MACVKSISSCSGNGFRFTGRMRVFSCAPQSVLAPFAGRAGIVHSPCKRRPRAVQVSAVRSAISVGIFIGKSGRFPDGMMGLFKWRAEEANRGYRLSTTRSPSRLAMMLCTSRSSL